jgi:hypothetical protein
MKYKVLSKYVGTKDNIYIEKQGTQVISDQFSRKGTTKKIKTNLKQIQIQKPYNERNASNNNWKGQAFLNKKYIRTSSTLD